MGLIQIGDVKRLFDSTDIDEIPMVIQNYKDDERIGVKRLVAAFEKKYSAYLEELKRLDKISEFENKYYKEGFQIIGGIDEVGRGPLAGPVVAAVVVLEKGCKIMGVNDSKKLSAVKREELYEQICQQAVDYSFGVVPPSTIDEINILQATYSAMQLAIGGLKKVTPDFLLVDAVTIPHISMKQFGIIQGDSKSISIGAASIIAKVERDRMMVEFDKIYPEYGFAKNKGYGSTEHIEVIRNKGICSIHRKSFVKNFI